MLDEVKTRSQPLLAYKDFTDAALYKEIEELADMLKGAKVIHVNATATGGGVAEILQSLVPLMRGVGLDAGWHVIPPRDDFFEITKNKFHDGFQGKDVELTQNEKDIYLEHSKYIAALLEAHKPDFWVIHDPQPLGIIKFIKREVPMIGRFHIDGSHPNQEIWEFFAPMMHEYDRMIYSMKEFVPQEYTTDPMTALFHPAIDPLTSKNTALPRGQAETILFKFGINSQRPLMTQISRFDHWKDPVGVIDAYRIAKKEVPDLQLALVGLILAKDDPGAMRELDLVKKHADGDPNIFIFSDLAMVERMDVTNETFVNAFQTASDVILQKSLKEGFGLTVSEAMWKNQPVIGGNVGGIKAQIEHGVEGFLVNSPKEAAAFVVQLLGDPRLRTKMGEQAHEKVRKQFLVPRLLRDYLKLFTELKR